MDEGHAICVVANNVCLYQLLGIEILNEMGSKPPRAELKLEGLSSELLFSN